MQGGDEMTKKWLEGSENLEITVSNDNGDKCEINYNRACESWIQDGYLIDPDILDKLGQLLAKAKLWI